MVRQMTSGLRTGIIYEKAGTINHQVSEGNRETVYGYRMVMPGRGEDPALLISFCRSTHRADRDRFCCIFYSYLVQNR